MKIYIFGPISGKSYQEVMEYYTKLLTLLRGMSYQVFYPMLGKEYLRNDDNLRAEGYGHPISTNHAIVERDKWMVSQCDVLFGDFSQAEKASIGSCCEIAWAGLLGKHVISVVPEGNPHDHAFILEMSDIVFRERDEALTYLQELAKIDNPGGTVVCPDCGEEMIRAGNVKLRCRECGMTKRITYPVPEIGGGL